MSMQVRLLGAEQIRGKEHYTAYKLQRLGDADKHGQRPGQQGHLARPEHARRHPERACGTLGTHGLRAAPVTGSFGRPGPRNQFSEPSEAGLSGLLITSGQRMPEGEPLYRRFRQFVQVVASLLEVDLQTCNPM